MDINDFNLRRLFRAIPISEEPIEPQAGLVSEKPITLDEVRPYDPSKPNQYIHDVTGFLIHSTNQLRTSNERSTGRRNLHREEEGESSNLIPLEIPVSEGESSNLTPLEIPVSEPQIESPVFHTAVEELPQMRAQLDGTDERSDELFNEPLSTETPIGSPDKTDDLLESSTETPIGSPDKSSD